MSEFVINGSFEQTQITVNSFNNNMANVNGWSYNGTTLQISNGSNGFGRTAQSGTQCIIFQGGSLNLYQDIRLFPGSYTFTWYMSGRSNDGAGATSMQVTIKNITTGIVSHNSSYAYDSISLSAWTLYSETVIISSPSAFYRLQFSSSIPDTANRSTFIDNVSLIATPNNNKYYYKNYDIYDMVTTGTSSIASGTTESNAGYNYFPLFKNSSSNYDKVDVGFTDKYMISSLSTVSTNILARYDTFTTLGTSQNAVPAWCNAVKVYIQAKKGADSYSGSAGDAGLKGAKGAKGESGADGQGGSQCGNQRTTGRAGQGGEGGEGGQGGQGGEGGQGGQGATGGSGGYVFSNVIYTLGSRNINISVSEAASSVIMDTNGFYLTMNSGNSANNGAKGATGATGATGAKGARGNDGGSSNCSGGTVQHGSGGSKGATGATGAKGAKGATGAKGTAGIAGTNAFLSNNGYIPSNISMINSNTITSSRVTIYYLME